MHLLSFHTIFILNENIRWLEEFIEYYLTIGFDHFYLYHNEGTIGDVTQSGNSNINKYGMPIKTSSSYEDVERLNSILEKYGSYITYVKWQPRDDRGNIIYGQESAIKDFIKRFGNETKWVACMDLDEYIFSTFNIDIRNYLEHLDSDISNVRLSQKKFKDRHISTKTKILEEYSCIGETFGDWWGGKNIFKPADFIDIRDIHYMTFKSKTRSIDPSVFRFNHYNVNNKQLNWMSGAFGKSYSLDAIDDGMKRYLKTD
jgi:hypothetical protein